MSFIHLYLLPFLAFHAGLFRGARISLGRDETEAPLKTPAWEASYLHAPACVVKRPIDANCRSFSLSRNKKINWKPPSGRSQENECYKWLIYKQYFQVSGRFGPQFLSYLPKCFTHFCRACYGDAILVYHFGAPIWPPEINKNIWS